jgi:hypothetical protein
LAVCELEPSGVVANGPLKPPSTNSQTPRDAAPRTGAPALCVTDIRCLSACRGILVSLARTDSIAVAAFACNPGERRLQRPAGEQPATDTRNDAAEPAASLPNRYRCANLGTVDSGPYFVVGDELDGASRAQQEPLRIGPEDLDGESHAPAGEAAAQSHSRTRAKARKIGRLELEAHRRPRVTGIDFGQRVEDVMRVGAPGDPRAPDARLGVGAVDHVVGRAG